MNLNVQPQYGPGARREWTIRNPEARGQRSEVSGLPLDFLAYSRTWTGAQRAIDEIKNSVARLDELIRRCGLREKSPLTQTVIDERPRGQRPQGATRQLLWKAATNHSKQERFIQ
jgi:hypothetical protein